MNKSKNKTPTLTATQKIIYFDVTKFLNRKDVKRKLIKFSIILIVFGLVIGGFGLYTRAYADKMYPKVMVASVDIGGLTRGQAQAKLEAKIAELNNNGPEITYNDQTLQPKLDEMGVTFDINKILDQAFSYGRNSNLPEKIKENYQLVRNGFKIEIKPQINQEQFDNYLSQLASVVEKNPVNAQLSISNGQTEMTSSEKGRGLDKTKLKDDLTALINSGTTSGKIVMQTSDLAPTVTEEGTIEAKQQAEKYIAAAPITVTFEGSAWTADRSEIGSWIKFSEKGDKLAATVSPGTYINWVAKQVEIAPQDREIEDGTGNVLAEGQDGRGADTNTLTAQINDALARGQSGSTFALATFAIPREQKTIFPHAQPGRFTGRYIDVNLSEQTLYAFEGGTLVNQFLISSGLRSHPSPTGEFSVYGKDRSALMDGEDYYLPNVPFISWFSGDYSIHGTYWHHNFGTPMSHGCINASTEDAEWLFGWDDIGTPVYIHY